MAEMVAVAMLFLVLGLLLGGAMAYDKGFQAGVSWAQHLFGGR